MFNHFPFSSEELVDDGADECLKLAISPPLNPMGIHLSVGLFGGVSQHLMRVENNEKKLEQV